MKLNQLIKDGRDNDLIIILRVDGNEYLLNTKAWNEYVNLYIAKTEYVVTF